MRECRKSGSVRGALSNARPYRDYEPHKLWWMLTRESWSQCETWKLGNTDVHHQREADHLG